MYRDRKPTNLIRAKDTEGTLYEIVEYTDFIYRTRARDRIQDCTAGERDYFMLGARTAVARISERTFLVSEGSSSKLYNSSFCDEVFLLFAIFLAALSLRGLMVGAGQNH